MLTKPFSFLAAMLFVFCSAEVFAQHTVEERAQEIVRLASLNPDQLREHLESNFRALEIPSIWSPTERALVAKHRVDHPRLSILLVSHMDHLITPTNPSLPASTVVTDMGTTVQGAGVLDSLGGLVQLQEVLESLRTSPLWNEMDVRIFISSDGAPADAHKRRSDKVLLRFATEAPIDLAMILNPGILEREGQKLKLVIPSELTGHYKLKLTLTSAETYLGEAKFGGGSAVDALAHVMKRFQDWRRDGRSVLIYNVGGGSKRSLVLPTSASASISFRFADADFPSELAAMIDELRDELKVKRVSLETERDRLLWSPQSLLSRGEMTLIESAANDLSLPRPSFTRGLHRGPETLLQNHRVSAIGSLGPVGPQARTPHQSVIVDSISPRVALCVRLVERLLLKKASP